MSKPEYRANISDFRRTTGERRGWCRDNTIFWYTKRILSTGFRFRKHHGPKSASHNDNVTRTFGLSTEVEESRVERWSSFIYESISVVVA